MEPRVAEDQTGAPPLSNTLLPTPASVPVTAEETGHLPRGETGCRAGETASCVSSPQMDNNVLKDEPLDESIHMSETSQTSDFCDIELPSAVSEIHTNEIYQGLDKEKKDQANISLTSEEMNNMLGSENEQNSAQNHGEIPTYTQSQIEIQENSIKSIHLVDFTQCEENNSIPTKLHNTTNLTEIQENSTDNLYQFEIQKNSTNNISPNEMHENYTDSIHLIEIQNSTDQIHPSEIQESSIVNIHSVEILNSNENIHPFEITNCVGNSPIPTEHSDINSHIEIQNNSTDNLHVQPVELTECMDHDPIQVTLNEASTQNDMQEHSTNVIGQTKCVNTTHQTEIQDKSTDDWHSFEPTQCVINNPILDKHSDTVPQIEIQESSTGYLHPDELTNYMDNEPIQATLPDTNNVKFVDLMDSSSINELKRLWEKPSKQFQKASVSNKKVSETITFSQKKYIKGNRASNKLSTNVKFCDVKLERVEQCNFGSAVLKVDLSLPNTPETSQGKKRGQPPLSKKTIDFTNHPEMVPVKKRGRPPLLKKTIEFASHSDMVPVKKRGRPPLLKMTIDLTNTSEIIPVKKLGRPPKKSIEFANGSGTVLVKKLGRPTLSKKVSDFVNTSGAGNEFANTTEVVPVKKLGRPPLSKKSGDLANASGTFSVKKRGRPPLSKKTTDFPNTSELPSVKKRGRPPLSKKTDDFANTLESEPFKKQGRPPLSKQIIEIPFIPDTFTVIKKRGRPPLSKKLAEKIPNTPETTVKKRGRPPLSKKTVKKVTEYVTQSYGLKCTKEQKNITKFVMKTLGKVAQEKTIKKGRKKQLSKHIEIDPQNYSKAAIESVTGLEVDQHKHTDNGDFVISKERMPWCNDADYNESMFEEVDLDLEDSADEYIPSEDEYKPKDTNNLRYAFSKKKKRKYAHKNLPSKRIKTENEGETPEQTPRIKTEICRVGKSKIKVQKRVYNRRRNKRIGRPPVFGQFECQHCEYVGEHKAELDRHARIHQRPIIQCSFCDKTFKAINARLEHETRIHNIANPFKCSVDGCEYAAKCKTDLMRHQSKHLPDKIYTCEKCGWRTKWRRNIRSHQLMKHSEERRFKCPECPFTAKRNTDLKQHIYRHNSEKPLQCFICGFTVKTNWELRSHMLTHSDHKPFKCDFPGCTAATKTNADLTKHKRVHITERKFVCDICLKGYKCRSSLHKHKAIHTTTRNFVCEICGNKFKTKPALRKHISLHSGIKPFKCKVCHKGFSVRSSMEKHCVTHDTTSRPFLCPLCPYAAKEQDHLLAHIGTFHGKSYTYFCEFCKKPFQRFGMLKIHYRRMHPKVDIDNLSIVSLGALNGQCSDVNIKKEPVKGYEDEDSKSRDVGEQSEEIKIEPPWSCSEDRNIGVGVMEEPTATETTSQLQNNEDKPESSPASDNPPATQPPPDDTSHHANNSCNSRTEHEEATSDIKSDTRREDDVDLKVMAPLICSSKGAKIAVYERFRLPLATKGFEFNYDKTGKKPNRWFMDVSCMVKNRDMEKQKKYLRRIGVLPPLPKGKGKRKKRTLTDFVNRRKRKLEESIRKSNFLRENKEALKLNAMRSARFQGNYNVFESVESNEVDENDFVQEHVSDKVKVKSLGKCPKQILQKKTAMKATKGSGKNAGSRKKPVKKQQKLLLSTEKKALKGQKSQKNIRKPSFIHKGGKTSKEKVSKPGPKEVDGGKHIKKRGRPPKSHNSPTKPLSGNTKTVIKKVQKDNLQEKRKYTKKYVPVKQQKKVKENKTKMNKKIKNTSKKSSKKNGYRQEISEFVIAPEPPIEIRMSHPEAALMNEQGMMLDKAVVLKTEDMMENESSYATTDTGLVDWDDSGVIEDLTLTGDGNFGMENDLHEAVKCEADEGNTVGSCMDFVIMEADSGKIKDNISVSIDTSDKCTDSGNDLSNLDIKEEPQDDYEV